MPPQVIEGVFKRNGMTVLSKSRAAVRGTAPRTACVVTLTDGRTVEGSHCLLAVGSVPNTKGIGLEDAGVQLTEDGHIRVNRVARTSMPSIYAAGDCSDFLPLASVASMQGRIAVFHAMGDAVIPTELRNVTSNIFTQPEIATVGWSQKQIEDGVVPGNIHKLELSSNPRAKMQGISDGFVKLFASTRQRHGDRRRRGRAEGIRADPADRARGGAPAHRRSGRAGVRGVSVAVGQHHGCRPGHAHRALTRPPPPAGQQCAVSSTVRRF